VVILECAVIIYLGLSDNGVVREYGRFRRGKRVTVRLDPDLVGFVERVREAEGPMSVSEVVRRALIEYKENYDRPRFYRVRRPG